jgi:hypothetical protein
VKDGLKHDIISSDRARCEVLIRYFLPGTAILLYYRLCDLAKFIVRQAADKFLDVDRFDLLQFEMTESGYNQVFDYSLCKPGRWGTASVLDVLVRFAM